MVLRKTISYRAKRHLLASGSAGVEFCQMTLKNATEHNARTLLNYTAMCQFSFMATFRWFCYSLELPFFFLLKNFKVGCLHNLWGVL